MPKNQRAKPQKDSPDLVKARSSWERGRFAEALHRFDKALRRQPNHPMALIDAARAFAARFQADKAAKILARLEKLSAGQADNLVEAAQAYQLAHRPDDVLRCLDAVLAQHPDHPMANYEFASLLESRDDLERAREHVERSLHGKPEHDEAKLLHARILSRLGDNDFSYAILVELSESGVRPLVRAQALLLTARIQEDEGDYEDAFDTMMESKATLERISSKARDEAEALEPVLMQLRNSVKVTHLRRWAKLKGDPELESPPLALMTAPYQSGQGLLGQLLAAHPSLAVTDQLAVFSEEIFPAALMVGEDKPKSRSSELFPNMDEANRQREAIRYRQLLLQCRPPSNSDTLPAPGFLIDNSPSIVPLIPSFLRIIPQGKIIVPLRDPRDILVSSLFAHFPPDRSTVAFSHPFDATDKITFELETWMHFRKLLDPKQWSEVRFEECVQNPASAVQQICEFLGVDTPDPIAPPPQTTQPSDRSVGRWKHYEEQLGAYYDELEPLLEPLGYG